MLSYATSRAAKSDIKTRQHLSERSYARSDRYGYKRARWRRLWRMEIQDFLIATIQNITVLIAQPKDRMSKSNAQIEQIGKYLRQKLQDYSITGSLKRFFSRFIFALSPS